MKCNLLAMVILALLAASAAHTAEVYNIDGNKLDIYGNAVGLHYLFHSDNSYTGAQIYAYLGFKGETQITDQLIGFSQWEYNFQGNNSESSINSQERKKNRLAFAGLKFSDTYSFDYGRNYGVMYDAIGWTDMLPEFGGDFSYSDNFMVGRTTGIATYRNTNFFGLVDGWDFAVQYQAKNNRDEIRRANGDGWGASTSYTSSIGITIVGAYASSNRTDAQQNTYYDNGSEKAQQWAAGLKYDANNVYLAAMYGETRNTTYISNANLQIDGADATGFANKTQLVKLAAQYQFDFGLRPSIAYVQSKGKNIEGIGDIDLIKYFEVGATYYFNHNMSTYVDYVINQIDDDNQLSIGSGNTIALGLVYHF